MRLIDADEFGLIIPGEEQENEEFVRGVKYVFSKLHKAPVAFDVDEVLQQLEKQAEQYHRRAAEFKNYPETSLKYSSKAWSYENAINIVKGSGKLWTN